jgi:hypothetical protein
VQLYRYRNEEGTSNAADTGNAGKVASQYESHARKEWMLTEEATEKK